MTPTVQRISYIVTALQRNAAGAVGARPVGSGYVIDLADGASRPATQAEVDTAAAWADARIAEAAADDADAGVVRGDAQVRNLMLMTPAQIESWAAANIGNLAQARAALVILAKAVSMLARRTLR